MPTTQTTEQVRMGQKLIIYAILLNIIAGLLNFLVPGEALLLAIIVLGLGVVALAIAIVGIVRVSSGLNYGIGLQVILSVLVIIPLVGLLTLLILNGKTTKYLRDNGYKVGLFGANP